MLLLATIAGLTTVELFCSGVTAAVTIYGIGKGVKQSKGS